MNRKIIQIATTQIPEEAELIVALCDDGTLWCGGSEYIEEVPAVYEADKYGSKRVLTGSKGHYAHVWHELPNVPQNTSNLTRVR